MAKEPEDRIQNTSTLKTDTLALVSQSLKSSEPLINEGLKIDHAEADRLVTRPSLLFSTLGDLTHDVGGDAHITVSDLLPANLDQKSLSAEPSFSPTPSTISSDPQQSSSEPAVYSDPFTEEETAKSGSLIGFIFKISTLTALLILALCIAMNDPRSPLSKGQWRSYAPAITIGPLNEIENRSHLILAPLYSQYLNIDLSPVESSIPDTSDNAEEPVKANIAPPLLTSEPEALEKSLEETSIPTPKRVEDETQDELKQIKRPTLSKGGGVAVGGVAVVSFTATQNCELSVDHKIPRQYLLKKSPLLLPLPFGVHTLKCESANGAECSTTVTLENRSKYPISCEFSPR